jgi:hypothetical protein
MGWGGVDEDTKWRKSLISICMYLWVVWIVKFDRESCYGNFDLYFHDDAMVHIWCF